MSNSDTSGSSPFEIDLDLHFLPAWAQKSPAENKYAKFEGGPSGDDRRSDRGDRRGPRRDFPGRPPGRSDGPRPSGGGGPRSGPRRDGGGGGGMGGGRRFEPRHEAPREAAPPPIDLNVSIIPEAKGVEALARQIRLTGRAYPLFEIAQLVLKKADRYEIQLGLIKGPDGQPLQPLFSCGLDDTLWLSEGEAVRHVLEKHFATFYQSEKLPADAPKGVYTFVAQCGISGTILGPPNYHDYQNKLRRLHQERFARMPFESFKARVKIVKDEAVVKKWIEDQSFRTEFTALNIPEEVKFSTREEVERHFRETHLANVIKPLTTYTIPGTAIGAQPCRPLQQLMRRAVEEQVRFPLRVVNTLSQQFASHGLQFFKVKKNVTHVSVARPRYLDLESTSVSDGVRRIVDLIQASPACNRKKLIEALVPTRTVAVPPTDAAAAPAPAPAAAGEAPAEPVAPVPAPAPEPSPELAVLNGDLHWLIHQGHVIEFANGLLELAKKPLPKPPKPEPKKAAATPAAAAAESAPTTDAVAPEVVAEEHSTDSDTDAGGSGPDPDIGAAPSEGSAPA